MMTWRDAWRELTRRTNRSLLSLLSVVIAVSAIVAVAAAAAMTDQAFQQVFRSLAGSADLEVTAVGSAPFDAALAEGLDKLPGVRAVVPVITRPTILRVRSEPPQRAQVLIEGIVVDQPESIGDFTVTTGSWPEEANDLMLDAQLAKNLGLKVGDEVRLMTSMKRAGALSLPCNVSGLIRLNDAAHLLQGGMVLAPVAQLQKWFEMKGTVDGLHLFLDPKANRATVIAEAKKLLAANAGTATPDQKPLSVAIPSAQFGMADASLKLTQVSLNLTSALSLTTAMFIVLNVFLMSVGERRRQISILRAIGATRRQIMTMVTSEALLLGVGGTLLGIPVGIYGGRLLAKSMAQILQINLPEAPTLWWPLVVGAIFGPLLCLIGAWHPARRASQISPLEGLRPHAAAHPKSRHRRATIYGLIGTAINTVLAIWCIWGGAPMWLAVANVILSLISVVLLLPAALGPMVRFLSALLGRLGGYPMEIAERLVVRETGRTSLTVGVLFMAVSAGLGTSNAVLSITDDIHDWYHQTMTSDYLLRTMVPNSTVRNSVTMPETLRDELKAIPGVTQIDTARVLTADANNNGCLIVARDFDIYDKLPLVLMEGNEAKVLARLVAGEVVVGAVLAQKANLHPGEMLDLTFGKVSQKLRVAGICNEYTVGGLIVYLERSTAEKLFGVTGSDGFLITTEHPAPAGLADKLEEITERDGLLLQSFTEIRSRIDGMVAGVVGGLWVLLALGLLVGALGVVNTLMMNVLEQTQELGMLRAIGMPRGQMMRTVICQAVLIGLLGIAAGAVSGLILAWMINLSLASLFGHSVKFAMRAEFVAILISGAVAIVLTSAILPALRAARLSPIAAMRSE